MATLSSISLILPSASPRTLARSTPSFSLSTSLSLFVKPLSASPSFLSVPVPSPALSSRFVRNVAAWSDVEEEESVRDPKLFVGNLPFNVDSAQLAGVFENAGNIETVEVIYDQATGRSRGFAFITMSTVEEAEAAAQQFNGYELEGRALRVNAGPAPPPSGRRDGPPSRMGRGGGGSSSSGNRVYVGNLSWGVDDLALETLFKEQGNVVEARVIYDRESGRSRGFGFVTYNSAQEADNAIDSLNGADLDGRSIRVSAAEDKPSRQF